MRRVGLNRPWLGFMTVGTAAVGLALLAYSVGFLHALELSSMDARFSIRGAEAPPGNLAIVAIDSKTITRLQRFPFPRRFHAQMVDRLRSDGVKQIAYDAQFTEPSDPRDDNALVAAVDHTPHVVLSTSETGPGGRTNVFGGDAVLHRIGARAGFTAFNLDRSGEIRRVPYEAQGLISFAVAAVQSAGDTLVSRSQFPGGSAWIDYYGPSRTFPTFSFIDVLDGRVPASAFRNKTVLVGATANNLQDIHATPFDASMPGVEIQANAIATVQQGLPLDSAPVGIDILLIITLGAAATLLSARFSAIGGFFAALGVALLYLAAAQLEFDDGIVLPVLYPIMALILASVGSLGVQYMTEAFHRQRTRDTFARFVPEPVVDEVLAKADDNDRLGGERAEVTIMFSDIRGFTTFSESRSPEEVLEVLNRYMREMTDTILDHGGTLVTFLGDGIMAVFGAPVHHVDHADRALAAAREMLGPRLASFNEWIKDQGMAEGFRMGIGLNSGPVMSGMVGSENRCDYTAIGDTVNTAARLEGLTKGTEHQLFVAESTRARLHSLGGELTFVHEMPIRGRTQGINVWTLALAEHPSAHTGPIPSTARADRET